MSTNTIGERASIESGSISDVVLHFIYMYSKTNAYGVPTALDLYNVNPCRYKKIDNLNKSLGRLLKAKLISFYVESGEKHYQITADGVICIKKLAMLRQRKEVQYKKQAGINSTNLKYSYDELL